MTTTRSNPTHNVIKNALVASFGLTGYKAAFDRCQTSKRFGTLEVLADQVDPLTSETFEQVVRFAKKLADNPNTKAQVK